MWPVRCKNCNTCFETYSKVMQTFHFSKLQNIMFSQVALKDIVGIQRVSLSDPWDWYAFGRW